MPLEGEEGIYKLPDEMLLEIFQYLPEKYLCRISNVCKRFWRIANDKLLWKSLYHQIYEYDQPLFMLDWGKFEFISESEYENPWKESFMQLYSGVHVRPGFESDTDRNLQYFDAIFEVMDYVKQKRRNSSQEEELTQHLDIIFLHANTYTLNYFGNDGDSAINIEDENVMLIGAASGNDIAKSVIIQCNTNIIRVDENLHYVYIGYLTLEITSNNSTRVCCLKILGSPTIDHCIFRNFNDFSAVFVSGIQANPLVKNCDISNCESIGLYLSKTLRGTYEDNVISYNTGAGIYINTSTLFTIRRNSIHQNNYSNDHAGIYILSGMGCVEDNQIYNNGIGIIISLMLSNVIIQKNKIFNEENQDHIQSIGVSFRDYSKGKLKNNDICNHSSFGVEISKGCYPVMHSNTMENNAINVFMHNQ